MKNVISKKKNENDYTKQIRHDMTHTFYGNVSTLCGIAHKNSWYIDYCVWIG